MKRINYEIAARMLNEMPKEKKDQLIKALDRNLLLTSVRTMSSGKMHVYKEGFYLELFGTRCRFAVWAKDDDGTFIYERRKPNGNRLHKLYEENLYFDSSDFDGIR